MESSLFHNRRVVCLLLTQMPPDFKIQVFAEACYRFTPNVALRDSEAVFLDIAACQNLFSEKSLALRLQILAGRFFLKIQMGFAADASTALAQARYGTVAVGFSAGGIQVREIKKEDLPLEALLDYAKPFGWSLDHQAGPEGLGERSSERGGSRLDEQLKKKILKIIEVTKKLGLKNLGDFRSLPPASLASRFGREGVELRARLNGQLEVAWPGFQISEKLIEKEEVEEVSSLEPLLFILKKLLDRSMARLRGLGKRASVIRIEFKLEPWSVLKTQYRIWQIDFPGSQGSTTGIMPILQDRLAFDLGREPLQAPVQRVRLQVKETVPGRSGQKNFFNSREEDLEKWNTLISRLANHLGKDSVFSVLPVDRYLPEKSWSKSTPLPSEVESVPSSSFSRDSFLSAKTHLGIHLETQQNQTNQKNRPARILKNPELLRLSGSFVIRENGKRWKTVSWNGPERLEGEWWKAPDRKGFERDYYQVMTDEGEELWIFLDRLSHPPSFYLQGYFD